MIRRASCLGFAVLLSGCLTVWASSGSEYTYRFARLSYMEGHVSFQHTGDVEWAAASINLGLQPGDRIYTGEDGRAEIEFDDGSVLRLAEKTDVEVLALKEDLIQIRALIGLSTLTVQSGLHFEFDTPAAAFTAVRKGIYRFDVQETGDADAIVRKGVLEAAGRDFSKRIESGDLIHVTAGEHGTQTVARYDGRDAWDEWNDRRNADRVAETSRRYLPPYVSMGVNDLDRYGHWVTVDEYGAGWVPSYVDAGWSPYGSGRWCYRPFWGWTWVSYEPWGWLPYHYGRWHWNAGLGWAWLPGPTFGFHFWSPGLVRFYSGPSWVSWCPLGPGDYYSSSNFFYHPTYRYYLNDLRTTYRRAPADLANRNVPGAFRTARTDQFASSSFGGSRGAPSVEGVDRPWERGRMVSDRLDVRPTSRSFAPAPDQPAARPTARADRPVVVRSEPTVEPGSTTRYTRVTNRVDAAGSPGAGRSARGESGASTSVGQRSADPAGSGRSAAAGEQGSAPAPRIWNRIPPETRDSGNAPATRIYQVPATRGGTNREAAPSTSSRPEASGTGREATPAVPRYQRPATDRAPSPGVRPERAAPAQTRPAERSAPAPRPERPAQEQRAPERERPRQERPSGSAYAPRVYSAPAFESRSASAVHVRSEGPSGMASARGSAPAAERGSGGAPTWSAPRWSSAPPASAAPAGRAFAGRPAAPSGGGFHGGSPSGGGSIRSAPSGHGGGGVVNRRGR